MEVVQNVYKLEEGKQYKVFGQPQLMKAFCDFDLEKSEALVRGSVFQVEEIKMDEHVPWYRVVIETGEKFLKGWLAGYSLKGTTVYEVDGVDDIESPAVPESDTEVVQSENIPCENGCGIQEDLGFVPVSGCPIHASDTIPENEEVEPSLNPGEKDSVEPGEEESEEPKATPLTPEDEEKGDCLDCVNEGEDCDLNVRCDGYRTEESIKKKKEDKKKYGADKRRSFNGSKSESKKGKKRARKKKN